MAKSDSRLSVSAEGSFESRPVYLRYVVWEVAVGQVFFGVLPCLPVSIIPPMLHNILSYTLYLLEG